MNLSGIPRTSLRGKGLRFVLRALPKGVVLRILQGPARGKKWIARSSNHGCWLGSYEMPKQQILAQTIQSGWVVYDVGAHVGFYTLIFSILVESTGSVFAFEPSPGNVALLRRHMKLNQCANVTLYQAAVTDYCGTARFDDARSSYTRQLNSQGGLEVRTLTLDSVLDEGVAPPHCIKMDIEGAEYQALQGSRRLLSVHRPIVFLATHGPDVHRHCCDLLQDLGYRLEGLPGSRGSSLADTDEILASPHP